MTRLNEPENVALQRLVTEHVARRTVPLDVRRRETTRKAISKELGISAGYLRAICRGAVSFSFPMGIRLLRALGISVSEFEKAMEAA